MFSFSSEYLLSFWIGIGSSLVSTAVIALSFLIFCRPNIKISPVIVKTNINGEDTYYLKFINNSKWFEASEIILTMTVVSTTKSAKGSVLTHGNIELGKSEIYLIPKKDISDPDGNYAMRIGIKADLDKLVQHKSDYLLLKIKSSNLFSGLSNVFEQVFNTSDIKTGEHEYGHNLGVL